MKTLYVVRHGETEWNVAGRMQGRLDSPLTERGRDQVQQHGRFLADAGITRMIVSPLGRALESAHLLNSYLQVPMEEDSRLAERDCGSWGGLLLSDIEKHFPRAWKDRLDDPYSHRPPGGENHEDVRARVQPLVDSLFAMAGEHVALVCHAIVSRALLTHLLALPPATAIRVKHPNELFYRLSFGAEAIEVQHVVGGETVKAGLRGLRGDASIPPSHNTA